MKVFQFSILILSLFLLSCGTFDLADIRGGLIKDKPDLPDTPTERVDWHPYREAVVHDLPYEYDGCVLLYAKQELSCSDCDLMDIVFNNPEVVSILNGSEFIAIKATDDMPDWESAVGRLRIKDVPVVSITSLSTLRPVFRHEGSAIPTRAFIGILKEASKQCRLR